MRLILKLILMGLAVYGISMLLDAVQIEDAGSAILFVLVLGILNVFVRPLLIILTIPVTIITLGLFLIVINAIIVLLADFVMDSVNIENFWWALVFSVLIAIANSIIDSVLTKSES
jgi:putative membrane protein